MELASYLAGERWSDHPACTHPLLAAGARDVNDYTSDTGGRLAELIPSVIGLTGDDLHLDARIAWQTTGHNGTRTAVLHDSWLAAGPGKGRAYPGIVRA